MNSETKSIAYALISNGLQIYLPEDENSILVSKLICQNCGEPWYMNLTECFLCGAINPFLYKCNVCNNYVSITNAGKKCNKCGKEDTLHLECPNPNCLSNKDSLVKEKINDFGGCFNKNSGFLTSMNYCLKCGSSYHKYETVRLFICNSNEIKEFKHIYEKKISPRSKILLKFKNGENISYAITNINEIDNENLIKTEPKFELIIKDIFSDF